MPFGLRQPRAGVGPILFTIYLQPVTNIMKDNNLQYRQYADDTQFGYTKLLMLTIQR